MIIGPLARPLAHMLTAGLMLSGSAWVATAQSHDDHTIALSSQPRKPTPQESAAVISERWGCIS